MAWTDDMIAVLRNDWEAGLSASKIGRKLGVTKNSVLGKKRILGLAVRYSPLGHKIIPPETLSRAKAIILAGASNKEAQQLTHISRDLARKIRRESGMIKERRPVQIARVPKPKRRPPPPPDLAEVLSVSVVFRPVPPPHGCLFPIGVPGKAGFQFCNDRIALDAPKPHSYCAEHRKLCYVRTKDLAA